MAASAALAGWWCYKAVDAASWGAGLHHCSCLVRVDTFFGRGRRAQQAPWQTAGASWLRWLPGYEGGRGEVEETMEGGGVLPDFLCLQTHPPNPTYSLANEYSGTQMESWLQNYLDIQILHDSSGFKPETVLHGFLVNSFFFLLLF